MGRNTYNDTIRRLAAEQGVILPTAKRHLPGVRRQPRILEEPVLVEETPLRITITLGGVPPNWANQRFGHDVEKNKFIGPWVAAIEHLASGVSRELELTDEPNLPPRLISITLYRCWPPLDWDGSVNACKPLVDGLVRGGLLVNDKLENLLPFLPVQIRVYTQGEERTVISVTGFEEAIEVCPKCGHPY